MAQPPIASYAAILLLTAVLDLNGQANWSIAFLHELIRDPSKIASQEEALKQIEDIKSSRDVKSLVPVAFEAVNSRSLQAQLYGASALFSIASRPDGSSALAGETESILRLLSHSEPRVKSACVILTRTLKLPASLYEQRFVQFLRNPAEPLQVKPMVVGALVRSNSAMEEKKKAIGAFLVSDMPLQNRLDAYNAVASSPSDQPWHADLVAIGLRDRDETVKQNAIQLMRRLGPNAISRHFDELKRLSVNSAESSRTRESAQRALDQKW